MPSKHPTFQRLPQELVDQILNHVAAGQSTWPGKNLLQCALVSRSFRCRSQLHIFSSIEIGRRSNTRTRDEKIQDLLSLLQDNPHIMIYIEELTLECARSEYSWIFENPAFINIMKKISTSDKPLRKLALQADKWEEYNTLLLENPEQLRDIFFLPFIAPFITSLSLDRLVDLPIEIVTNCVNLADLELLHVEWSECDPTRLSPYVIHLQSLKHRLSRAALERLITSTSNCLIPAVDLSQLKSFTVYTDELSDLDFEQQIIDAACESLEEIYILTMDIPQNHETNSSLDLRALTRLRQLHAHVLFPDDSLGSIRRTLSTVRSASLENIFIDAKVSFLGRFPPEVVLEAYWAEFCSEVARVMAKNEPRFEFKITYRYRNTQGMNDDSTQEALADKHCKLVIARMRIEHLKLLVNDPRFTVALSYVLEFWWIED